MGDLCDQHGARGVRASRTRWLSGKMSAAGQLACHRFPFPARSVTGWPDHVVSAAPAMAGRGMHNQEVKMAQGTVKWFNGGKGLWLHRGRGRPGLVRAFQRDHRRLPQPGRRAEGRVRHHPGPEGTPGRKRQDHRLTYRRERRRRRRRSPRRTAVTRRRAADRVARGELPGHRLCREISSGLAMLPVPGFAVPACSGGSP